MFPNFNLTDSATEQKSWETNSPKTESLLTHLKNSIVNYLNDPRNFDYRLTGSLKSWKLFNIIKKDKLNDKGE